MTSLQFASSLLLVSRNGISHIWRTTHGIWMKFYQNSYNSIKLFKCIPLNLCSNSSFTVVVLCCSKTVKQKVNVFIAVWNTESTAVSNYFPVVQSRHYIYLVFPKIWNIFHTVYIDFHFFFGGGATVYWKVQTPQGHSRYAQFMQKVSGALFEKIM